MVQRRHHYEQAFEHYLRTHRVPYVAVNEARRALFADPRAAVFEAQGHEGPRALKSFDFVLYGEQNNLLAEIKGRRVGRRARPLRGTGVRLESWVTLDDLDSMTAWQSLFGDGFRAAFIFVYWWDESPPGLFDEVIEFHGRWYALRAVLLDDFAREMRTRSPRWRTMDLSMSAFERISGPLVAAGATRSAPVRTPAQAAADLSAAATEPAA